MCGNNSGLWIIIVLILLFSCGNFCGYNNCCGNNGCDNNCCNNNCC